jgi:hypothetical protein
MFLFDSTYEVYYGFNDVIPPTTQTVWISMALILLVEQY